MRRIILLSVFMLVSLGTFANGYRVALQSTKHQGLGHTGAGYLLDASSLFFNPGAITFLDSTLNFSTGISFALSKVKYQNQETFVSYETDNPVSTPLEFYATYKINQKLSVGLSITTPFGSTIEWPDDWTGRSSITSISLKAFFIQPTIAYQITDWLSLGAGFIYSKGTLNLQKKIPAINGGIELDDVADGTGYSVGVYMQPTRQLSFGVNYRSEILMEVDKGKAIFTVPPSLSTKFAAADKFTASLPLPQEITFGIGYRPTERLLLAFDVNFIKWNTYDKLVIGFETNEVAVGTEEPTKSISQRQYENTVTYRLGLQYDLNEKITGRLGYYFDPTPSPSDYFSPETPTLDNHAVTAGLSFQAGKRLSIDASVTQIFGKERYVNNQETGLSGDFVSSLFIPSIGISLKL